MIGMLVFLTGCKDDIDPPAGDTVITDLAIAGVTAPVAGQTPAFTVTETAQYTGTVSWEPSDNPFLSGTTYTATITLTPKSGFTLDGVGANSFTVAEATTATNPVNSGEVTAVFPPTDVVPDVVIDIAAIPGVTAPATGSIPNDVVMDTMQYTGTVLWNPSDNPYLASTDYTATITLLAKPGFTLDGVDENFFTVAGATPLATNPADSGVVTATFPATGSEVASLAPVELGKAGDYVILAQTTITTTGSTVITGDLGLSPAAASYFTGFGLVKATGYATSSLVVGQMRAADMAAPTPAGLTTAVANMNTAYNDAAGRPTPDHLNLDGGAIGGMTLASGLYKWTTSVNIASDITLDGSATDVWIFQISNNLNLANGVQVLLSGEAKAENIFWQVAEIATLGTGTQMEGIILSKTDIILQTGAKVNGRLLAQTQVTLDAATVVEPVIL